MTTVVTNGIACSAASDLDPTPVYQLEEWQRSYDPQAAAELDAKLDAAFGVLPVQMRRGLAWPGDAGRGLVGLGEARHGVPTKSGSAEAEPPTTGSIA